MDKKYTGLKKYEHFDRTSSVCAVLILMLLKGGAVYGSSTNMCKELFVNLICCYELYIEKMLSVL